MHDPDPRLDDTVEFSPWDDGLSAFTVRLLPEHPGGTGGRVFAVFARAAARVLDRAAFARFQLRALFTCGRFIGPDDSIPYVLTEKAKQLLAEAKP